LIASLKGSAATAAEQANGLTGPPTDATSEGAAPAGSDHPGLQETPDPSKTPAYGPPRWQVGEGIDFVVAPRRVAETLTVALDAYQEPLVVVLDRPQPSIAVHLRSTRQWRGEPMLTPAAAMVQTIRSHYDPETGLLRIVMDIDPERFSDVRSHGLGTDIFVVEISGDAAAAQP
jgi:hypothetical protein